MSEILDTLKKMLMRRRWAYQTVFAGPQGELVLKDLARFCRAHSTTFHADQRVHALLEGRREVWERIARHRGMTADDLWRMYSGTQKED